MPVPSQQQLTLATVNQKVIEAQYAVRGAVLDRALELEAELEAGGSTLPFDKIVRCNIGNPQALGQKPLTFVRQVLCLVMNPELLKTKKGSGWAPSDVVARARAYLKAVPSVGAYTHSQGIQLVRDEVASMFEARDEFPCDANDIFLTEGASAGVKIIIDVRMREKRDAVLTPMPQYPLYSAAIALRGGTLAPYHLDESKAWGVNVATLRKALRRSRRIGCEVRAMVVINPGNPTGMTLDEPTMRGIVALCAEERLVLMADEVYQKNVYSAARSFISFKKVLRTMERDGDVPPNTVQLISFHSISKGFTGECGLRGGFFELIGFNAEVKQQMFKLASIGLCSGVPGQLVVGLTANPPREGDPSYKKYEKESSAILASLRSRQIKIVDALRELDGVTCNDADGAMYAFPRITMPDAALAAAEARDVAPDALYALELVEATGIVVVPGSGFGQVDGTHHIRITILPPEDELDGVLARLTAFHARFMANETHALADELVAKKAGGGGSGAVGSSGAKKSGPSKIGKMLRRTFVAFALFACFFALMKAGHQWMIFTVLLIQVELYREFTNVRYDRGLEVQIPLFRTFLYSCFFSTVFYMQGTQGLSALIQAVLDASSTLEQPALSAAIARVGDIALQHFEWIAFSLFAMSLVVFVISLRAETLRYQFKQLAWTCLALVIVCAQSTSFTPNILNGFFWFYVPATMVVGNDTLAVSCRTPPTFVVVVEERNDEVVTRPFSFAFPLTFLSLLSLLLVRVVFSFLLLLLLLPVSVLWRLLSWEEGLQVLLGSEERAAHQVLCPLTEQNMGRLPHGRCIYPHLGLLLLPLRHRPTLTL